MLKAKVEALRVDVKRLGGYPIRIRQLLAGIKSTLTPPQVMDIQEFADKMDQLINYAMALEDQMRVLVERLDAYEKLDVLMGRFVDDAGLGMPEVMTDIHKGALGAEPDGAAQYVPTPTREFVGIAHRFSHTDFVKLCERVETLEKTVDYLREEY